MAAPAFEETLGGGKPRTLQGVDEVLIELDADPARLPELIDCCSDADAVVSMRAADALEKFARRQPLLVSAHVDRLDAKLSASTQPSIQWHLAQIYGEVPLTDAQRGRATAWLLHTLDAAHDWIVLTCAMTALASLADADPALEPALRIRLERHAGSPLPSVAKRAGRLLARTRPSSA